MDDLISRQAVLEATSAKLKITGKENAETVYGYIKKLCDDIKALPSAQQWIPCSERLPKDDETVIVTRDNDIIAIATFEVGEVNNGWWLDFWYSEDNVKAWMPLPKPYKGEQT